MMRKGKDSLMPSLKCQGIWNKSNCDYLANTKIISEQLNVTGEQPLKLAHSLLVYAVGMTDIYRPGWPITRLILPY